MKRLFKPTSVPLIAVFTYLCVYIIILFLLALFAYILPVIAGVIFYSFFGLLFCWWTVYAIYFALTDYLKQKRGKNDKGN